MTEAVYRDLVRTAAGLLRAEPASDLEPEDLVALAWARVLRGNFRARALTDPAAVVPMAVQHMRRELVDQGRRRRAAKRTARPDAVAPTSTSLPEEDVDMARTLERAAAECPQGARVAFLFVGGATEAEVAEEVERAPRTVQRWLRALLELLDGPAAAAWSPA